MSQAVEGVEGSSEAIQEDFSRVLRSRHYIEVLYGQVEQGVEDRVARKLVTIADFKSCGSGIIFRKRDYSVDRRLFTSIDSFRSTFREAIYGLPLQVQKECGAPGFFAEAYATAMWFLDRGAFEYNWWSVISDADNFTNAVLVPVAYDFVIDIDLDKNAWLLEDGGLGKLNLFCKFMSEKLGLEPEVLISRGVQLRATLLPLHLLQLESIGIERWSMVVMRKLPEMHKRLALKLAHEFGERFGVKIGIDTQVYDASRLLRLDLSIHSGIKAFSVPFKPHMLEGLTWDRVRELQKSPRYIVALAKKLKNRTWGRIVEPKKYLEKLGFLLTLEESGLKLTIELPSSRENLRKRCLLTGYRRGVDPTLGEIEYDAELDGFGWVEVLVRKKIPILDGRLAFCWSVLPVAIKGPKTGEGPLPPLITREEAIEWLRISLEKYPDPEKSLEDYVEKLDYNLRYGDRYNIPTWRHLIEERAENGERLAEVFLHVKYPVVYALYLHNYVKLNQEQAEKLKKLVGYKP